MTLYNYILDVFEIYVQNSMPFTNRKKNKVDKIKMNKVFDMDFETLKILNESSFNNYMLMFTSDNGKLKSLNLNNFRFNNKFDRIASKDYRVMIHTEGNIPQDVLMNAASVALFMLTGKIEFATGYIYILDLMHKYNCNSFFYAMGGYLQIKIGSEPKFNLKSSVTVKKEGSY